MSIGCIIIFAILLLGPLSSSAGKVFPFVKLKVIIIFLFLKRKTIYIYIYFIFKFVDLITGEKVGPNEMGEIAAETPFMTKGYLNKPMVFFYYLIQCILFLCNKRDYYFFQKGIGQDDSC